MHPQSRQIDWMRELHAVSLKAIQDWGARLSTWLVAGNATALVLGFNAILGGTSCASDSLAPLLWPFVVGLALAFAGGVASYLIGLAVTKLVGDVVNTMASIETDEHNLKEIEGKYGEQPDDSILARSIDAHNAKIPVLITKLECEQKTAGRILWLYAFSMLAFTFGILAPTLSGTLLAACAG